MPQAEYLLVDARVLPEVFSKVVHAKRLLAQGKAKTLSDATRLADISRSAFYKYRDSVFTYENKEPQRIETLYAELMDEAGVLSLLLTELGRYGANILTINQNIPVDGVAPVSISIRTNQLTLQAAELVHKLQKLNGIVTLRLVK